MLSTADSTRSGLLLFDLVTLLVCILTYAFRAKRLLEQLLQLHLGTKNKGKLCIEINGQINYV